MTPQTKHIELDAELFRDAKVEFPSRFENLSFSEESAARSGLQHHSNIQHHSNSQHPSGSQQGSSPASRAPASASVSAASLSAASLSAASLSAASLSAPREYPASTAGSQTGSHSHPGQLTHPGQLSAAVAQSGLSSERLRLFDPALADSLTQLARLMANVTDAYTAAIFLAETALPGGVLAGAQVGAAQSAPYAGTVHSAHSSSTFGSTYGSVANFGSVSGSGSVSGLNGAQSKTAGSPPILELTAYHTLSREIVPQARIAFGNGLIGWTAENGVRISVCPFEHDASTLLFYSCDQALKSFIALPILDSDGSVLGVLSCDSKKSYAFAKITEKILIDCASQIAHLVTLHSKLRGRKCDRLELNSRGDGASQSVVESDELVRFLDHLRNLPSEERLLAEAATLSQDLVERDALVIVTSPSDSSSSPVSGVPTPNFSATFSSAGGASTPRRNLGSGIFPSPTNQPRVNNRLLELVCRHRGVLCSDRNVHALTSDEKLQRSFLSIPFRVMNREAGSINVLSRAFASISASEIQILERVAEVLGHELELHRLRERHVSAREATGLLPWRMFQAMAAPRLEQAMIARRSCSLIRVRMSHLPLIEDRLGIQAAQEVHQQLLRLLDQVKGSGSLACYLAGPDSLIFIEGSEPERLMARLRMLVDRLEFNSKLVNSRFTEELKRGILSSYVTAPKDGETIDQLAAKSLRLLEAGLASAANNSQNAKRPGEEYTNAVCW